VKAAYPAADQLFLIHDNWPVHWHPEVLMGLCVSKLTLRTLPIYAPWLNPAEKVWRRLCQDVLHLHPRANAWEQLQASVQAWLDLWAGGSADLLCCVGFCPAYYM
jgi:transposase